MKGKSDHNLEYKIETLIYPKSCVFFDIDSEVSYPKPLLESNGSIYREIQHY